MSIFGMITTKDSSSYTQLALQSLKKHTPADKIDEIILIDNDNCYELPKDIDRAKLNIIKNKAPLGFAANGNLLLDLAARQNKDLVFMNNDLVFTPNWYNSLASDNESIVSPCSNREFRYQTNLFNTDISMSIENYQGHETHLEVIAREHAARNVGYLKVLVLPFFCIRIPNKAIQAIGKFDESFGKAGGEDYDYCLRAYELGFSVYYGLSSYILHFGGKSTWGVEAKDRQLEREQIFTKRFTQKWGEQLSNLILNDTSQLNSSNQLQSYIQKQDFSGLIKELKLS